MTGLSFVLVVALAMSLVSAFVAPMHNKRILSSSLSMADEAPGAVAGDATSSVAGFKNDMLASSPFFAAAAALVSVPMISFADDVATGAAVSAPPKPAKVDLGPVPIDFGLKYKDFYEDCKQVVKHMRYAIQMDKGTPGLAEVATNTKTEMLDFVSYYRRFNGIAGKQSFSLLYTSVNVLAGHYTSYGVKFPVPEKRRKRLMQEFNDIEKNIRKKR